MPDNNTDEPNGMLPPVVSDDAAATQGQSQPSDFAGHVPEGQTMPTEVSLVPTPEIAADSDLIEKEWVDKAKQIVDHTSEDPFKQQEELSKMRADYMKKRYNKDLGAS